jgi:hypothetical protein
MDCVSCSLGLFQKPPLGGRPNTKPPGEHDTPNAHNRWFILFYRVGRDPHEKTFIGLALVEGPVTYDFTLHLRVRDHTAWFWRWVFLWWCLGTFLLGSHNFKVTALGLCVKVALSNTFLFVSTKASEWMVKGNRSP